MNKYLTLARIHLARGEPELARSALQRTLKDDPDPTEATRPLEEVMAQLED